MSNTTTRNRVLKHREELQYLKMMGLLIHDLEFELALITWWLDEIR